MVSLWLIIIVSLFVFIPFFLYAGFDEGPIYVAISAVLFLIICGSLTWCENSDVWRHGPKEYCGHLVSSEICGDVYEDTEDRYFIVKINTWDITQPTRRVYLNGDKVENYFEWVQKSDFKYDGSLIEACGG